MILCYVMTTVTVTLLNYVSYHDNCDLKTARVPKKLLEF